MKYLFLAFALMGTSFSLAAANTSCMCLDNPEECRIGNLTCSGTITAGGITKAFNHTQDMKPDDDRMPFVSIQSGDYDIIAPLVASYYFIAGFCDGQETEVTSTLLIWENTPPKYQRIEKKTQILPVLISTPMPFHLITADATIAGECTYTKYKK